MSQVDEVPLSSRPDAPIFSTPFKSGVPGAFDVTTPKEVVIALGTMRHVFFDGAVVLEIGFGDGMLAAYLQSLRCTVYAIEVKDVYNAAASTEKTCRYFFNNTDKATTVPTVLPVSANHTCDVSEEEPEFSDESSDDDSELSLLDSESGEDSDDSESSEDTDDTSQQCDRCLFGDATKAADRSFEMPGDKCLVFNTQDVDELSELTRLDNWTKCRKCQCRKCRPRNIKQHRRQTKRSRRMNKEQEASGAVLCGW